MAQLTPARKLFDLLVSRDFDPEMLDVSGKPATDPAEAEIFSFDFRAQSGKDYGTVVIMLSNEGDLEVYCADNVGKTMEGSDKTEWFQFLEQLKNFAVRNNRMNFGIKNLNHLRYSMQGQAAIKEGLFESWSGKKDVSYNAGATESRLMIKHKRNLGEDEARFRYVESLFIETAEGERYKLPFKNLTAGKAMLEHVRNGGRPYDSRGQHIAEMVNELTVLSRFRRANTGRLLEGDTAQLVEQTNAYYENLQHNLKSLTSSRGYNTYFESWAPAEVTEESVVIEGLKHLFVTQSIDQRIEDALPLIARIQQQGTAMKEANIFETWADRLIEGTWSTPDTPEKQTQLLELMSTDLPVGADATNATEQLYDLIGDDDLFDQLHELAERDANADARQVIFDRMQELSHDPDVRKVIEQLNIDATAEMNPPEATNPADLEPMNESVLTDSTGSTFQHILNTFKRDVKDFEATGEVSDELHNALYDYYFDDMPYGTKKARDGDPYEWVADRFGADLGIDGYGSNSPGMPDEDYGMERESVMHGDYAEEATDPLAKILKIAGVPAKERPAPDYTTGDLEPTDEGILGTAAGGLAGLALGGPLGAIAGAGLGQAATDGGSSLIEKDEERTEEGWKGQLAGGTVGTLAGGALGAVGGPIGSMVGGALGGTAGQMIGDKLGGNEKEETDEGELGTAIGAGLGGVVGGIPGAALGGIAGHYLGKDDDKKQTKEGVRGALAGGALGGAATRSVKGAMAGAKLGSAIQDRFAKKPTDETIDPTNPRDYEIPAVQRKQAGQSPLTHQDIEQKDRKAQFDYHQRAHSRPHPDSVADESTSPLAGQYGHSGKMKEVGKDTSFLDRLKELSGMKK
jgi:hypothetical protein